MTREELEKMFTYNMAHAALEFHEKYINKSVDSSDVCEAFEAGAEWACKFIIKRACKWMNKTLYIHTEIDEDKDWGETNTIDWVTSDYDSVKDFINGFCKAMEE